MSRLRKAVQDYIEMRHRLGFKLHDAQIGLLKFVSFLEQHKAFYITIALAMQWAQENPSARLCEWARRLSFVRGFARHWSATDPRTEVPPWGLLPHRPGRARPYLYSDEEIRLLLEATLPQGSPKTGHTGSPPIRPYGRHGLWSQAGLWKSRQRGRLVIRSAIPVFAQPQQQHHLICRSVQRKTTALYAPKSNNGVHDRLVCG